MKARVSKRDVALYLNAQARAYTPDGKPLQLVPVRAARTSLRKPSDPLRIMERDVLKAGLKFLRLHPRVASVERTQSGVFQEGNRVIRVGFVGKLDVSGFLKDGARYFEFEAKRPGGKLSYAQEQRIKELRGMGALTGVFTSVDELAELLR